MSESGDVLPGKLNYGKNYRLTFGWKEREPSFRQMRAIPIKIIEVDPDDAAHKGDSLNEGLGHREGADEDRTETLYEQHDQSPQAAAENQIVVPIAPEKDHRDSKVQRKSDQPGQRDLCWLFVDCVFHCACGV